MKNFYEFVLWIVYRNMGNCPYIAFLLSKWMKAALKEEGYSILDINMAYEIGNIYEGSFVYEEDGCEISQNFRIIYDGVNLETKLLDTEIVESNQKDNLVNITKENRYKPSNNMLWAILSTLFCCLPLGIVSIIYASKVNKLYRAGDYQGAQDAADKAKKYALYGVMCALVVHGIQFLTFIAGAMSK